MFDVFYRFYPYKLFLGKEGKNAVEHILNTFGVLDKNTLRRDNTDDILKIEHEKNSCVVTLNKNNSEISLKVRAYFTK